MPFASSQNQDLRMSFCFGVVSSGVYLIDLKLLHVPMVGEG